MGMKSLTFGFNCLDMNMGQSIGLLTEQDDNIIKLITSSLIEPTDAFVLTSLDCGANSINLRFYKFDKVFKNKFITS